MSEENPPKYKMMLENKRICEGRTLYRVEALRDFGDVKKGTLGGYIEDTRNLSFYGNCWVADKACVFGQARVSENAVVAGRALVRGRAMITNDAYVGDHAYIRGDVFVGGRAIVQLETFLCGTVTVAGRARLRCQRIGREKRIPNACGLVRIVDDALLEDRVSLTDNVIVCGQALLRENARLHENVIVSDAAVIQGGAILSGNAVVFQNAVVSDRSKVTQDAIIGGHAMLLGKSRITGRACIVGYAVIKSESYSGDNYVTGGKGSWLVIHPVCPPDVRRSLERREHVDVTSVPAGCH